MKVKYRQICSIQNTDGLAALLQTSQLSLYHHRFEKNYDVFYVKKPNGKDRLIENPKPELKQILRTLSDYLQCAYFFNRSPAAYGFLQQPRGKSKKRNIVTNARRHCGKQFMLNIDLEDFFHQLSKIRVCRQFRLPPFNFSAELSNFLAELCTYKNRLPMGSPASPVLSNFCTLAADADLDQMARDEKLTYTRYVDDLTFSSNDCIRADIFYHVQAILAKHGLRINMNKVNWMGVNDEKTVTGLILKEKPEVPESFINGLRQNIDRLKHVLEFSSVTANHVSLNWINKFRQHIQGKLRFIQMIYGAASPVYTGLKHAYTTSFSIEPFAESFNWNDFPYF